MYLNGLCFITEIQSTSLIIEEIAEQSLRSGVKWLQYRDKKSSRKEIYEHALKLRQLTKEFRAFFTVNDHVDIALAVNADGVHLGQEDFPLKEAKKILTDKTIIGISTHSLEQAINAEKQGADYIGFGPVFRTKTKDAGEPKGIEMLKEIKNAVKIPLVAIGGINAENLSSVLGAGADAVAAASAISNGDIPQNISRFLKIIYKDSPIL